MRNRDLTMTSIEKETGLALSVEEVGRRMAMVAGERISYFSPESIFASPVLSS